MHIPPKFVRRLSFTGNPNINNATGFGELIEKFPQLLELDVSFTGLKELPETVANEKIGVLDIEGRVTTRILNLEISLKNYLKKVSLIFHVTESELNSASFEQTYFWSP